MSIQDKYPVLRKAIILDTSAKLDRDTTKKIRKHLTNKIYFNNMIKNIEDKISNINCAKLVLDPTLEKIKVDIREGMVVNYPKFFLFSRDDICYEIKISNTMCIKPNHSKVWIRVSYCIDLDQYEIPASHLDQFFNGASIIADAVGLIVTDLYREVFKDVTNSSKIKEIYFIKILTITDHLIKLESSLQSRTFKFLDYFGSAMEYNSIKWILKNAHDKAIIDLEDYMKAINNGNFEWFTMNTSGDRISTGLYYKHHLSDQSGTEFFGVMHSPNGSSQQLDSLSKNFSGAIVRMTSPFI